MITVPNSLFNNNNYLTTFSNDKQLGVIHKVLTDIPKSSEIYATQFIISIPIQGMQKLRSDGNSAVTLNPLDVAVIPRGIYTVSDISSADTAKYEGLLIFVTEKFINDFLNSHTRDTKSLKPVGDIFYEKNNEVVSIYIKNLFEHIHDPYKLEGRRLELRVLELLELLYEISGVKLLNFLYSATHLSEKDIPSLMHEHACKPLKIEDYAYLSGRSVASFRRDFKKEFNMSPNQWILKERLRKAKDKLTNDKNVSVTEAAYQSGFNDLSYFTRKFKSAFNLTPGEVLKNSK